eukprot:3036709-Pleurochrysis_carterae.AAC.1
MTSGVARAVEGRSERGGVCCCAAPLIPERSMMREGQGQMAPTSWERRRRRAGCRRSECRTTVPGGKEHSQLRALLLALNCLCRCSEISKSIDSTAFPTCLGKCILASAVRSCGSLTLVSPSSHPPSRLPSHE